MLPYPPQRNYRAPGEKRGLVNGTVDCKNRQPALWLVESGENEDQIQIEDALAEQAEDGVVYLRVMNNSYFPRKLRKGMRWLSANLCRRKQ